MAAGPLGALAVARWLAGLRLRRLGRYHSQVAADLGICKAQHVVVAVVQAACDVCGNDDWVRVGNLIADLHGKGLDTPVRKSCMKIADANDALEFSQ